MVIEQQVERPVHRMLAGRRLDRVVGAIEEIEFEAVPLALNHCRAAAGGDAGDPFRYTPSATRPAATLFELRFSPGPTARRIPYRFTKMDGSCCSPPNKSSWPRSFTSNGHHRCLHREIGDIPPAEMETAYYHHHRPEYPVPTPTPDMMQNPGRFRVMLIRREHPPSISD